jgi:hypothetical protein
VWSVNVDGVDDGGSGGMGRREKLRDQTYGAARRAEMPAP